jgi:bla regulator protein blaR1
MHRVFLGCVVVALASQTPFAFQTQSPVTPAGSAAFEVASVKPNKSSDPRVMELDILPSGVFTARNVPLRQLILLAYDIRGTQLSGGPSWIGSDRFDIDAKADGGLKLGAAPPQLRQLLLERFNLKVHKETREVPIYALVLARSDGRLGPALHPLPTDYCAEVAARGRSGQPAPPPPPAQRRGCVMRGGSGTLTAGSMPISTLAGRLVPLVNRVVEDRTGLRGVFDFDLEWTPDEIAATDLSGPSIFTALQEQLGLKLESAKGPVDVLIIDSVERLTED